MPLMHDNFGSLLASVWELTLAVQSNEELNNLLSINLYFHRRKKQRWTQESMWQG